MQIKESISGPHHHLTLQKDGQDLGTLDWDQAADEAQIIDIVVKEEHRRNGYGIFLTKAFFAQAKKMDLKKAFLEVRNSNKPAIDLYKKCGFSQAGVRKGYYNDPKEDALLFELDI